MISFLNFSGVSFLLVYAIPPCAQAVLPLNKLEFDEFNEPTKILVRKLFMTEAKRALGRTRGKFGGVVGPPEAERTMDYETLISEANDEYKMIIDELDGRLERLRNDKQLERAANEAENLNKHLKYRPLGFYVK